MVPTVGGGREQIHPGRKPTTLRTSLPVKGWINNKFHGPTSATAQSPMLRKCMPTYNRGVLCQTALSLVGSAATRSCGIYRTSKCSYSHPCVSPWTCKKGGEMLAGASWLYPVNLSTWLLSPCSGTRTLSERKQEKSQQPMG